MKEDAFCTFAIGTCAGTTVAFPMPCLSITSFTCRKSITEEEQDEENTRGTLLEDKRIAPQGVGIIQLVVLLTLPPPVFGYTTVPTHISTPTSIHTYLLEHTFIDLYIRLLTRSSHTNTQEGHYKKTDVFAQKDWRLVYTYTQEDSE